MATWALRNTWEDENFLRKFWRRVRRGRRGVDDCWMWEGSRKGNRWGVVYFRTTEKLAHEVALEIKLRRRLHGHQKALHSCGVLLCCNPNHLYEGYEGTPDPGQFIVDEDQLAEIEWKKENVWIEDEIFGGTSADESNRSIQPLEDPLEATKGKRYRKKKK